MELSILGSVLEHGRAKKSVKEVASKEHDQLMFGVQILPVF